jgi:hypothetical protein
MVESTKRDGKVRDGFRPVIFVEGYKPMQKGYAPMAKVDSSIPPPPHGGSSAMAPNAPADKPVPPKK